MKTIEASDAAAQLDELLDALENDRTMSVLIQSNGRDAAMLLKANLAQVAILGAYSAGLLSRTVAMQHLGIEWYGDLLIRLHAHGIKRPAVSKEEAARMTRALRKLLGPVARASNTGAREPDQT